MPIKCRERNFGWDCRKPWRCDKSLSTEIQAETEWASLTRQCRASPGIEWMSNLIGLSAYCFIASMQQEDKGASRRDGTIPSGATLRDLSFRLSMSLLRRLNLVLVSVSSCPVWICLLKTILFHFRWSVILHIPGKFCTSRSAIWILISFARMLGRLREARIARTKQSKGRRQVHGA